jgi:hypothetical protein
MRAGCAAFDPFTVSNLAAARKQKTQRWFHPRCPRRFAVISVIGFHVQDVLCEFPAVLDQPIE